MKTIKLTDKQVDCLLEAVQVYGWDIEANVQAYLEVGRKADARERKSQIKPLRNVVEQLGFIPEF
ncbi:MAG: hypothetical protein CML17_00245 [Pusillimonas sp.]|nr:hypothetical protein [Pusillimonas sp.]|tara:strand:+ start:455 stop:649 length:195 start_codon:yes stop_codon:yes gene_type:complete